MDANRHLDRIRWQCRRGMLELDHLLSTFVDQHYLALNSEEKAAFEELLSYPDQELYEWLLGWAQPIPIHLRIIVEKIRNSKLIK